MSIPAVTQVKVLEPYVLEVTFRDGEKRLVDLEDELTGEVFEPLRDFALFSQASVDPLWQTVVWPNGADLAPEYLYEERPRKARKKSVG